MVVYGLALGNQRQLNGGDFGARADQRRSLPIVPEHRELVGPLTIELAQKTPIFTGYLPIRISQLPLKLPPSLRKRFGAKNSQYLAS